MINYMIRINVNISIVDMIDESFRKVTNNTLIESECIDRSFTNSTTESESSAGSSDERRNAFPSIERLVLDFLGVCSHVWRDSVINVFFTHVQANLSNFNWIIKCLLCSSSVITITSRFLIKLNWVNLISRDSRSSMSAEVSNGMSISKAGFLALSSGFILFCNYLVAFLLPNTAQKRFLAIQISLDVFSVVWCQWLHISISTCWSSFEFFKESFVQQRGPRCTTCQLSGFLPTSAPPSSLHTLVLRWV